MSILGVGRRANPPIHWRETNNIRWKIPRPLRPSSMPMNASGPPAMPAPTSRRNAG
jgi:hypothetical protein